MKVMKRVLMVTALTMVVVIVALAADSAPNTCNKIHRCGDAEIPYPFGIYNNNKHCFSSETGRLLKLNCTNYKIYAGNMLVLNINISKSQTELLFYVAKHCGNNNDTYSTLTSTSLTISSEENKFLTVGNNSYGYLNTFSDDGSNYSTGCLTRSFGDPRSIDNGTCSGIGCCQVGIPPRMTNISIEAKNYVKSSKSCSYAFVVKNGNYTFSSAHLSQGLPDTLPVVFDWTIGNESCTSAMKNGANYGCKNNSKCDDKDAYNGYRCKCKEGYEGNPYDPIGCKDIDECENGTHECKTKANCKNTDGNHTCFCPNLSFGDGKMKGGCQNLPSIVFGVGAAFILLFAGTLSYLIYHKKKFIKLKEKLFEQNGGLFLRQYPSSQNTQIFTEDELKKATKNFDEKLIIGTGGFGTVFKGFLDDKRVVAIKKSKQINKSQIKQFIDEVVVLSQINHRNVVKLLGCCLETKVPLLVYEFVTNGTLSNFIHNEREMNNETWKIRLGIAAQVAGALSYLHSGVTIPIIHSDVKSDNILLHGKNIARVSDFGASKFVPLDQTHVAAVVQGTLGYLDPEFMQTCQLTDKSDVYSFGVVLVELLTGEKPFRLCGPEKNKSLVMHFLSHLKKDKVFDVIQNGMRNEENEQEIKEVAVLAAKCLRQRGEKRPSMKEVAMELEGMMLMDKKSWNNDEINIEESQYFLHESSSSSSNIYELGDSSKHGDVGYDSLKDRELIVLDDGR